MGVSAWWWQSCISTHFNGVFYNTAFTTDILESEGGTEPDHNSWCLILKILAPVLLTFTLLPQSQECFQNTKKQNWTEIFCGLPWRRVIHQPGWYYPHLRRTSPHDDGFDQYFLARSKTGYRISPHLSTLLHGETLGQNSKFTVQGWHFFFPFRGSKKIISQARKKQVSVLAVIGWLLFLVESHYAVFSKIVNVLLGSQWETTLICITVCEIKCMVLLLPLICLPFISALSKNYKKTELQIFLLNFFTFHPSLSS